jgi:outer membrane protein OmpA-like peptidoglycan-associated protein
MRSNLIYSAAIFLLSSLVINAQTDVTVSRKEFKLNRPGFNEAWKHITNGDAYFAEKGIWYNDAFNEYLQALVYNSANAELNYKTGVSALFSDKKEEAAPFFQKAWTLKKNVSDDILLLSGRSLMYAGRYTEAMEKLTAYLNSTGKKSKNSILEAREYIHECSSALLIIKDTMRISVMNAGQNINSPDDEYSEVLTSDGNTIYFASRRELPGSGKRNPDTKFDESIMMSRISNGGWGNSVIAGKELATKYCETPLFINRSNTLLYVYEGSARNGDIKVSEYKKGSWRAPQKIKYRINTSGNETSFAISPLGSEICFVSDKGKNNIGGKDIYFIQQSNTGSWSKPFNAGSAINTIYDEEGVRFSADGDTLWFSSKGHNSIGGFDIFYSVRGSKGWEPAINCGYPVNTAWDELFYVPSPVDDSLFYFASNRSGGFGGSDIYQGRILPEERVAVIPPEPEPEPAVIPDTVVIVKEAPAQQIAVEQPVYLMGRIKDSESGEPVLAKVDLAEISTGEIVGTTASSETDGSYRVKLPAKKSYNVDLHATGFLSDVKRIDVPDNWSKENYNLNIDLIKVKVGKKVVLKNILFETGKSILTPASFTELDHLLTIMNENAEMKIEISGHTDKTGSEPLNAKLSEARAKAVVDYMIKNGILNTRMIFKGYGSSQPISDNTSPAGRAKNRRVEFKILEF